MGTAQAQVPQYGANASLEQTRKGGTPEQNGVVDKAGLDALAR